MKLFKLHSDPIYSRHFCTRLQLTFEVHAEDEIQAIERARSVLHDTGIGQEFSLRVEWSSNAPEIEIHDGR